MKVCDPCRKVYADDTLEGCPRCHGLLRELPVTPRGLPAEDVDHIPYQDTHLLHWSAAGIPGGLMETFRYTELITRPDGSQIEGEETPHFRTFVGRGLIGERIKGYVWILAQDSPAATKMLIGELAVVVDQAIAMLQDAVQKQAAQKALGAQINAVLEALEE